MINTVFRTADYSDCCAIKSYKRSLNKGKHFSHGPTGEIIGLVIIKTYWIVLPLSLFLIIVK